MKYTTKIIPLHGTYYPSTPVKVTILAAEWDFSYSAMIIFTMQLANQLARSSVKSLQVSVLIPENAYIDPWGIKAAENCGVTIVKAKRQPGFPDPTDWLHYPPEDLKTDIVMGIGPQLGRIAQHWKERYQCKNIQIAGRKLSNSFVRVTDECIIEDVIKELSIAANLPVAIGPKTTCDLSASLRSEGKQVFNLTPGIISEFSNLNHATNDGRNFRVLLVGRDDPQNFQEDLRLDLAVETMAELNDKSYHLIYVGAGKGTEQQFANLFHQSGLRKRQLEIRSLPKTDEEWKDLFCEVDLAIMPSGDKEFGWEALLALSAGLPVLVHGASGFGEAIMDVKFGTPAIVDSDDAREWASQIKKVRETDRKTRLEQAALLCSKYDERYSWEKQLESLAALMVGMVSGVGVGFSLNLGSAGKGPFITSKAENMHHGRTFLGLGG